MIIIKIDKQKMRLSNKILIVEEVFNNKNVTRAQLCSITNLNKATMTEIIKELMDEKIVNEIGPGISNDKGGRRPIMLEINKEKGAIISIEVDCNHILYAIHLFDGEMIFFDSKRVAIQSENVLLELENIIINAIDYLNGRNLEIVGSCIAIHGIVKGNRVIFSPKYNLKDIDIAMELTKKFFFPVFLENEANVSVLAEATFKINNKNLVNLNINSGIGAGIFMNGKLIKGFENNAGEVGHSIYDESGPECSCGNRGCIELYASNSVLEEQIINLLKIERINYNELMTYYETNDKLREIILNNIRILSVLVNNIIVLLAPDFLIINSPVFSALPEMIKSLESKINFRYLSGTKIMVSNLAEKSTLYGCYSLVIRKLLNIENIFFL